MSKREGKTEPKQKKLSIETEGRSLSDILAASIAARQAAHSEGKTEPRQKKLPIETKRRILSDTVVACIAALKAAHSEATAKPAAHDPIDKAKFETHPAETPQITPLGQTQEAGPSKALALSLPAASAPSDPL